MRMNHIFKEAPVDIDIAGQEKGCFRIGFVFCGLAFDSALDLHWKRRPWQLCGVG